MFGLACLNHCSPLRRLPSVLALAALCVLPCAARASTRTVTNLNDSGAGSLRAIIATAASGDTIDFAVTGTIALTSGALAINKNLTITGPGAKVLTVQRSMAGGTPNFRIFTISNGTPSGPTVRLSGLTMATQSFVSNHGGGILNDHGTLALDSCTLSRNYANDDGGAIYNDGSAGGSAGAPSATLTLSHCTFDSNRASDGGAIYNNGDSGSAKLTLRNCTLDGNSGGDQGGAIYNNGHSGSASLTLLNCTLSNGGGSTEGGAIYNNGDPGSPTVLLQNCTLSGNNGIVGGAIANAGGTVTVTSSTLSGNTAVTAGGIYNNGSLTLGNTILKTGASGENLVNGGTITSKGYNLSNDAAGGDGSTGPGGLLNHTGDIRNTEPLLGPLANNGGLTPTCRLLAGSPALDQGKDINFTFKDQRGLRRPIDLATANASGGEGSDIGAYELQGDTVQGGPSFLVNTLDDHDDGGSAACTTGDCTLREAIRAAGVPKSVISFSVTGTITVALGEFAIGKPLTIKGPGATLLTVSGNNASRVFHVTAGPVGISGLTMANGKGATAHGGGVFNAATLTLSNCTLTANQATIASAGGVYNASGGTLTMSNCTLSGNNADNGGGAIGNAGTLTMGNSTLAGNSAGDLGGGLYNFSGGTVAVSNCTLSGNSAQDGGGLYNEGSLAANSSTCAGNAATAGGGLYNANGVAATVSNSLIAGNVTAVAANGPDVFGGFTSNGYNLVGKGDGSSGLVNGANHDQVGTAGSPLDPKLGPLQDNDGPTQTRALLSGSPALDAGSGSGTDQRGRLRPIDLPGVANADNGSDIGAYEFDPVQTGTSFMVTTRNDHDDGACTVGDCSLREAIKAADGNLTNDTIRFASTVTGTIPLILGELAINQNLSVRGPGAAVLTVSGNGVSRSFHVAGGTVSISGLTIANGFPGSSMDGGGIYNSGTLTLADCTVSNNTVVGDIEGGNGGGIYNTGTMSLTGCTVSNNTTDADDFGASIGAGIYNAATMTIANCTVSDNDSYRAAGGVFNGGSLTVTNSTFSGNQSGAQGGGIDNDGGTLTVTGSSFSNNSSGTGAGGVFSAGVGSATVTNSTFSNNSAETGGGIDHFSGVLTLRSCTLSGNHAFENGGGIYDDANATTNINNSIIAGNTASNSGPDVVGAFTSNGYNLIGNGAGSNGFTNGVNHDRVGTGAVPLDPKLGPLRDNGGPTPTMALLPGSPAIDAGNSFGLTTDQRGQARPVDNPTIANAGDGSDIGAYEKGVVLLRIDDVSVAEGDSGATDATFTVSLTEAFDQTVTVQCATENGLATAPADYSALPTTTLTFLPGETTQPVKVKVVGDTLDEANEGFKVNLSNPVNAVLADSQGRATILDDDPIPTLAITDVTVTETNSGTVDADFAISLSAASGRTATVTYKTAGGTATAGSDYGAHPSTVLTFAAGDTSKTVTVKVSGDTADEANETFKVVLQSASFAAIVDNVGVGTITDDDPLPVVSIANAPAVSEDGIGAHNALFVVTLTGSTNRSVGVTYATADGTAKFGSDYTATSGTVTFLPGTTRKTIVVPVLADALDEANETFKMNLTGASFATIGDSQGVATITDNDPTPALSIDDVSQAEGNSSTTNFTFVVKLSAVSGQTVTVAFAASDGTAVKPADYSGVAGTLTFAPGTLNQTVSVPVKGETLFEPNETFFVSLSGPSHATLADNQGKGTILNDDPS